ncbi:hypothetical protein ACWDG9_16185 [Streptomyces sp. NPDC001073]
MEEAETLQLFNAPTPDWLRNTFDAFRHADVKTLNHGLGVDSTGLTHMILDEPERFGVAPDFSDFVVVTAILGDEFEDTNQDTEKHLYGRLRSLGVRTVQVSRRGPERGDGIAILSDTRSPTRVERRGPYTLRDELLLNGTIPTASGGHRCSMNHKAWTLDTFARQAFPGARVGKLIGYNADEARRATKSEKNNKGAFAMDYPLIRENFDRTRIARYVTERTGVTWGKSYCSFCPFSGVCASRPAHLARLRKYPHVAAQDLLLEYRAMALNPRSKLYVTETLYKRVSDDGQSQALGEFEALLEQSDWAVYHVRRAYGAARRESCQRSGHPKDCKRTACHDASAKGAVDRSVETVATGSRQVALQRLKALAAERGRPVQHDVEHPLGLDRVTLRYRPDKVYGTVEQFYVLAPAGIKDKEKERFPGTWGRIVEQGLIA